MSGHTQVKITYFGHFPELKKHPIVALHFLTSPFSQNEQKRQQSTLGKRTKQAHHQCIFFINLLSNSNMAAYLVSCEPSVILYTSNMADVTEFQNDSPNKTILRVKRKRSEDPADLLRMWKHSPTFEAMGSLFCFFVFSICVRGSSTLTCRLQLFLLQLCVMLSKSS